MLREHELPLGREQARYKKEIAIGLHKEVKYKDVLDSRLSAPSDSKAQVTLPDSGSVPHLVPTGRGWSESRHQLFRNTLHSQVPIQHRDLINSIFFFKPGR